MVLSKLQEWLRRYGPPELAAIITVVLTANATIFLTGSVVLAALLAPWAENLVFYSIVVWRDSRLSANRSFSALSRLIAKTFVEFGPAEYIDSLIVRPALLAFLPLLVQNYSLAILSAALLANISYYIPVIISREYLLSAAKRTSAKDAFPADATPDKRPSSR